MPSRRNAVFVPRKSRKPGRLLHRPKRNTSNGGTATGRKTSTRPGRTSIARPPTKSARASMAYDEARYRERQVLAPSAATVEVLDVRPGDLIAPNAPIATLLERD